MDRVKTLCNVLKMYLNFVSHHDIRIKQWKSDLDNSWQCFMCENSELSCWNLHYLAIFKIMTGVFGGSWSSRKITENWSFYHRGIIVYLWWFTITITPQPETYLRTHPTLAWVSSQVSHHVMIIRLVVALYPMQGWHPFPVLSHRTGTNFTSLCGVKVQCGRVFYTPSLLDFPVRECPLWCSSRNMSEKIWFILCSVDDLPPPPLPAPPKAEIGLGSQRKKFNFFCSENLKKEI